MIRKRILPGDESLYLSVLEALKENGYESYVVENKFNRKRVSVKQNEDIVGWVFVVADRRPQNILSFILELSKSFREAAYQWGAYRSMTGMIKMWANSLSRKGYEVGVYWPEESNVGAYTNEGAEHDWLSIVQHVIG